MFIREREKWKRLTEIKIEGTWYEPKHIIYVSNYGHVRRYYKDGWVDAKRNNYIELTPQAGTSGHMFVGISVRDIDNKYQNKVSVHRLVATLFVPNPDPKTYDVVNHIDCDPTNNFYKNLEWTTYSGNSKHAFDNNRSAPPKNKMYGSCNSMSTHDIQQILKIKNMILSGVPDAVIAKEFNERTEYIHRIRIGSRWGNITGFGGHEVIDFEAAQNQFKRVRDIKRLIVEGKDDTDYILQYVKDKYGEELERSYVIKLKSKTKKQIAQGKDLKLDV